MEYKCDLRKEDKNCILSWKQDGVLVQKQNPAFRPKMVSSRSLPSVKQSLYDPAKNIEQYFKTKKPRSYKYLSKR